jgi:hypothetical protein
MLSLLWFAILAPLAQAECDDFAALVESAEQAVVESRTEAAGATLRQAEAALGCSAVPAPALLARMWLAEGTRAYMQGDEKVARLAFAAAARVAPDLWVDSYGPQVKSIYTAAAGHESAIGSVRIHPDPEGWSTTLDGLAVDFPADAPSGLHLIQVGHSADNTDYAEIFFLPPGDTYFILTGLEDTPIVSMAAADPDPVVDPQPDATAQADPQPLEAQPLPDPKPAGEGFGSPVFLVLGGAAAAVAGGAAIAALAQDQQMEAAVNIDSLDRSFARQKSFATVSYSAAGVAVASVGVHVALSF